MKKIIFIPALIFLLFSVPLTLLAQESSIQLGYRNAIEKGVGQTIQSYLKLPQEQVTRFDLLALRKDLIDLKGIVDSVDLGDFSAEEIKRPLTLLIKEIDGLPMRNSYRNKELTLVRKWSRYLVKEPVVSTLLAKDDVVQGKKALDEKKYDLARDHFAQALIHLSMINETKDPRLEPFISRISSEITILRQAALKEELLKAKRERSILNQIRDSFKTYHDTVFNMWSIPQGREP